MHLSLHELAWLAGASPALIKHHLDAGRTPNEAVEAAAWSTRGRPPKVFSYHASLRDLALLAGVPQRVVRDRLRAGGSPSEVLDALSAARLRHKRQASSQPSLKHRHLVGGEWLSVPEMSARCGIQERTLRYRLAAGMSPEAAMRVGYASAHRFQVDDEELTLRDVSDRTGLSLSAIRSRVATGWSLAQVAGAEPPPERARRYLVRGERLTVAEGAAKYGVSDKTIMKRLERGMAAEDAFTRPATRGVRAGG